MTAEVADRTAAAAPLRGDAQRRRVTHAIAQATIIAVEMLRCVESFDLPESRDRHGSPARLKRAAGSSNHCRVRRQRRRREICEHL
jgi:hypothetical protein